MITTVTSNTLAKDALSNAYQHLLSAADCPPELLIQIQVAMSSITFENDPSSHFSYYQAANGLPENISQDEAKKIFLAGYNFCQEEMGYIFEGDSHLE